MNERSERFRRIEAAYQAALDEPVERRGALLDRQCAGDPALRREVEALLASYEAAGASFLETPAHDMPVRADAIALPERVGRFRILELLGAGGMGVVYRAEQENPQREVALKIMRPGASGHDALRRFELESALLARLSHPGIAQVYEAGAFDDGGGARPFFAMELVRGVPLTTYIQDHQPAIRTRLELVASVCDAVQYAHQKGIIHRDLKPSNILVVRDGTTGALPDLHTKILDFGIARATDSDIQTTSLHTDAGQVLGTLPYMSPEQVTGDSRRVDTRTDVYALGALLYEALAGRVPIDVGQCSIAAAARQICDEDPVPLTSASRNFRGDLNTIVLKALEKDPDRRYPSALELAADIRRYLRDEPITARPATTLYQLRKYATRNRGLVAGGALALIVLIVGAAVSTTLAVSRTAALAESERQREIAQQALAESEQQREIAQAVNDFLNKDLLGQANPDLGATPETKLRDVLDKAAAEIDTRFLDKPAIHASIRAALGRAYYQLGAFEEAERHLAPAVRFYETAFGPADSETHELRHARVQVALNRWKLDDAAAMLDDMFAAVEEDPHGRVAMAVVAYGDLGILRKKQGRFPEAEQAYRKAIEMCALDPDIDEFKMHLHRHNLAITLHNQQKHREAEEMLTDVVAAYERIRGEDSEDTAYVLSNLGAILRKSRPGAEGLVRGRECLERALDIRTRRLGSDHPETLRTNFVLASFLHDQGEYAAAESLLRDILARRQAIMEEDHVDVLDSMFDLAKAVQSQGRLEEAAELYRLVLQKGQARYGPGHFHVQRWGGATVRLLNQMGDRAALYEVYADFLAALEAATQAGNINQATLANYVDTLLDCEIEELRDPVKALHIAELAIVTGDQTHVGAVLSHAAALKRNGRPEEALAEMERALSMIPAANVKYRQRVESSMAELCSAMRGDSGE